MPLIATDASRLSYLLLNEYEPSTGYCRDVLTVNEAAAATFPVGTVLGKVTATGKYKRVEASANDGSQVAVAVVIGDKSGAATDVAVAAATDTPVLALTRGPVVLSAGHLLFGASVNTAPLKQALYGQLKAVGLVTTTTI